MATVKSSAEEYVLVLPAASLWRIGYFQGLSLDRKKFAELMSMLGEAEFKRRADAETDPAYKQIIPYVILAHHADVFSYRRGKLLNEARLLGSYSIGVGGHISISDSSLFHLPYIEAMRREIAEEVEISCDHGDRIVGLINDDTNDVGKVHLGIVHLFNLQQPQVKAKEKSINEAQFCSIDKLLKDREKYENWSQICIGNIKEIIAAGTE